MAACTSRRVMSPSTPVPVMIFFVAALDFVVRLKRFDPVGVVERRLV